MASDFYIWRWADNNLSGHPTEIVAQLCIGEMPASLQPFEPNKISKRLDEVATQRRSITGELLIQPQVDDCGQLRFIHLCDPSSESAWLVDRLLWAVWDADLTLYDESANRLIGLPKRNVVEVCWGHQLVDIDQADVPGLLRRLGSRHGLGAVACYDRNGNMFQVWAHQRRFTVEWQVLPQRDFSKHRIWRAGQPKRIKAKINLGTVNRSMEVFDNEALSIAEAQRLWESFFRDATRPSGYIWRDITKDLNTPGNPVRHRHEKHEEKPPL